MPRYLRYDRAVDRLSFSAKILSRSCSIHSLVVRKGSPLFALCDEKDS